MGRVVKTFFAVLSSVGAATLCLGADPSPESFNARAMAMGGAVTSLAGKTVTARANPASIAPERGYFAGATYLTRQVDQLDAIGVNIVDNNTAPIAGAFNYLRVVTTGESEEVGLSLAAGTGGYYWGATGRFAHTRKDRKADWDSAFVGDVGMLIVRDSGLRLGLVGRDLFTSYKPLEGRVAFGVSYDFELGLTASTDYVRYLDRGAADGTTYHFGLEWTPGQTPWTMRAGYMNDRVNREKHLSGGLGWSNQRINFDYCLRQNMDASSDIVHVLSFTTPF